MNFHLQVNNKR